MQPDVQVSHGHFYTMRDLNQRTAEVMREINEDGQPAIITRHGRVLALITPLVNERVESAVLGAVLAAAENSGQLTGDHTIGGSYSAEVVAADLGVKLSSYAERELE
jgi:prevent-host-death family protein